MALLRHGLRRDGQFRLVVFALLAGCALVGGLQSGVAQADEKQNEPPKAWHLEGRVVDEQGGPVAGARVFLDALPYLGNGSAATTESDSEGQFQLEVPQRLNGRMVLASRDDGRLQAYSQLSYEVEKQSSIAPLELILRKAREIVSTVVDADNRPVADAVVLVSSGHQQVAEAMTDSDGAATMRVPADLPVQYAVAMKAEVGLDYWIFRRPDEAKSNPYTLASDHAESLEFVLNGTRNVMVRVVDERDQPMVDVMVYPWLLEKPNKGNQNDQLNLSGLKGFSRQTDARGMATFDFIPGDNNRSIIFWARAEGYYAQERYIFDPASDKSEIEAKLVPLVPIAGRVVFADGRPAADIEVRAVGAGYTMDQYRGTTRTDPSGEFDFQVNPDQYYQFFAGNREWATNPLFRIVRPGKDVDELELVLQPAIRVHGQVTIGPDNKPMSSQYVELYQESSEAGSYYNLPEDSRLPNPKDSTLAILPQIVWTMAADSSGRFEFFVRPGNYYLIGPRNIDPVKFEVTDQESHEANIHSERPENAPITGRVVLRDNSDQGVAEATVSGVSTDSFSYGRDLDAVSEADGRFHAVRGPFKMVVYSKTSDGKLAGIVKIGADDAEVVIPIGPTASARGRLMDDETNGPAADRQIDFSVRIDLGNGISSPRFGGKTKTDSDGQFEISGLVVGQEYNLNAVIETDSDGHARSWRTVGKVTATTADSVDLGELRLPVPYRPLTTAQRVAKAFEAKQEVDARVRERVRDGRLAHQRVLLVVGAEDNPVVQQLFEFEYEDKQPELAKPLYDYLLLPINASDEQKREEATELAARFKFDLPEVDGAALVVLDEEGALVAQIADKELVEDGKIAPAKLLEFLQANRPQLPDAEVLLTDAIAKARREGKRVFVQVSGARCGWCFVLSRYLDEHHELFEKEFAYVKLDDRWEHGSEVIQRVRPKAEGGIPWMVILDESGEPLITSDGPEGNIGYPGEPEGAVHFEKMLRAGAKHLTDDDIAALVKPLGEKKN